MNDKERVALGSIAASAGLTAASRAQFASPEVHRIRAVAKVGSPTVVLDCAMPL